MAGRLKKIAAPGGRLLARIPQRSICPQSNFGAAYLVGGVLMRPAFSPLRIRTATLAATELPSCTECIGPPTVVPSPKKLSLYEKIGAFAMLARLLSAALAS